jgi:hypothetical protein
LHQLGLVTRDECGSDGGKRIGWGNLKYSEETCPKATLSTRNPRWLDHTNHQTTRSEVIAVTKLERQNPYYRSQIIT